MNIYRINTTAFEEEDFFIMTDLTQQDIVEVVNPMVMAERDGYEQYDNDSLCAALKRRYPKNTIEQYNEFETIVI